MLVVIFVALIFMMSLLMLLNFWKGRSEKISVIEKYEDRKIENEEDVSLREWEECERIQRKQQNCEHRSVRKCRVGYDGGEEDYFVCRECGASSTRRFGEVRR